MAGGGMGMPGGGNNLGKNIQKVKQKANDIKKRADNGKNYDVMNPEESNPNLSDSKKEGAKSAFKPWRGFHIRGILPKKD